MTATDTIRTSTVDLDTQVAERPLIRKLAEWRLFIPFAGRVLALQGSHPTIAAGIYQHSNVFEDPFGRAERTFTYLQRILFGPDRAGTAAEIRELHRDIKGTGYDGRPYHAWNREAWTWVHLTTFEATVFSLRKIHGNIPRRDLEALYRDVKTVGVLYGVREGDMPDDIAGLRDYIVRGIEEKLTHVPADADLTRVLRTVPHPTGVPLPSTLWSLLRLSTSHGLQIAIVGSFPDTIRRRWGLRWTPLHEAEYRSQILALRTATAPLPDRLRMLPYPYHVLHAPRSTLG
jgi:uncharacterized protein (DUF2236 family)